MDNKDKTIAKLSMGIIALAFIILVLIALFIIFYFSKPMPGNKAEEPTAFCGNAIEERIAIPVRQIKNRL